MITFKEILTENFEDVSVFLKDPGQSPAVKILRALNKLSDGSSALVKRVGRDYIAIEGDGKDNRLIRFGWGDTNKKDVKVLAKGSLKKLKSKLTL